MNCPYCRRGVDYVAELSTPNAKDIKDKQLVYHCASCATLLVFKQFSDKTAIGGRLVMTRDKLKRAGFLDSNVMAHAASGGEFLFSKLPSKPPENDNQEGGSS